MLAYGATFRLVGPNRERMVPAAEYFTMPTLQNVQRENVLAPNELLTHVILPAGRRAERARLIAFATVLLTMNGSNVHWRE